MTYDEKVALQKLYKAMREIDGALARYEAGDLSADDFAWLVKTRCADVRNIPHPGDPPELTGKEVGRILRQVDVREKGLPLSDEDE